MKATTEQHIKLQVWLSAEEYEMLKLACLDVAMDGVSDTITASGKEAMHRILGFLRPCFEGK